jgi:hypothetical protein
MSRIALALAALLFLAGGRALAQDDEPIPYPEDFPGLEPLRDNPAITPEPEEPTPSLAGRDDPSRGFGQDLLAGVLLLDRAHAGTFAPRFAWGTRFNWELGRLFPDGLVRDSLFADVTWIYGASREGTQLIFDDTHYHYFTAAPAWEVHVDKARNWAFFGQLGAGVAYEASWLRSGSTDFQVSGVKPALQYGLGFRGRPLLVPSTGLRLSLRLELTRYRRGYMDDTLFAASAGASF